MGKMKYKISSRATLLLGRESVSKVDGAIIELVKNTYDADATICLVCFDFYNDTIYILDNGDGMNEAIIEHHWMMIGTDNKKENYISDKKRIKSGEKGIGRFALDRLGSICEMYTKHKDSDKVIRWRTDWESFEQEGKNLDEIEADFEYIEKSFYNIIPEAIVNDINQIKIKIEGDEEFKHIFGPDYLATGTLFKISRLRDNWSEKTVDNLVDAMGYLIPPTEQNNYILCSKKSMSEPAVMIESEITEEFDYKIKAVFDGEQFHVKVIRNEFDLDKIPEEVFSMERFKDYPFRKQDFEKKIIENVYTIAELMSNRDNEYIKTVKDIGEFRFNYVFMKMSIQDDSNETFYYKEISKNRKIWLDQNSGIKIYRDNFFVRPYGDINADAHDWLGLDARRAQNPAAISHPTGKWHVRNRQGQGTILISRVSNDCILDKSSREGIIENDYFRVLKDIVVNLIACFEKDRAYIGYSMKQYADIIGEKEKTKEVGRSIADSILSTDKKKKGTAKKVVKQAETLAKAVKYYEEERVELISEIKLLRSLATNGLITTSIVHDLKGINALLVNRVDSFKMAVDQKNDMLVTRGLADFRKSDVFLKAWISVLTNQIKSDKRRRLKKDVYVIIKEIIPVLEPILTQKKIVVNVKSDENQLYKRIFISDFESIIYNLIINSIESFEKCNAESEGRLACGRVIDIGLESNEEFILHYADNGNGIDSVFKNPYDIFSFGTTSKYDKDGEQTGTGLGMYIVASTAREYNAVCKISKSKDGFGLDIVFPI